jgi:hypothetical protein
VGFRILWLKTGKPAKKFAGQGQVALLKGRNRFHVQTFRRSPCARFILGSPCFAVHDSKLLNLI